MLTKNKVLSNKILSNTGLDISGSKLSNVVNNNITVTNKEANKRSGSGGSGDESEARTKASKTRSLDNPYDGITVVNSQAEPVDEPVVEPEQTVSYGTSSSSSTNSFGIDILKKIISLYSSNSLKLEGKLVLHNAELIDLIKSIMDAKCSADITVEIDVDYEVNCCGTSKGLNCINKILIKDSDESKTVDMKYKYNEEYNALQQFGISLKFTVD